VSCILEALADVYAFVLLYVCSHFQQVFVLGSVCVVFMCACINMFVCMYYVCMRRYHARTYVTCSPPPHIVHVCMDVFTHEYMYACMYACMYECVYACAYATFLKNTAQHPHATATVRYIKLPCQCMIKGNNICDLNVGTSTKIHE
jgi:hypothetical protein